MRTEHLEKAMQKGNFSASSNWGHTHFSWLACIMAKYSLLIILGLTHLNFAFGQGEELPLAYSEIFEYLEEDGEVIKKSTNLDLTQDLPEEIIVWIRETKNAELKRTRVFGIVEGDTLSKVSIQKFDPLGNLVLEIDSSDHRLTRKTEYQYKDSILIQSSELLNFDKNWEPTTTKKTYFYENGNLVKTVEKEKGENLAGLLSDEEERIYYRLFEYNKGLLTKEIRLTENDTISVTNNTYNNNGDIVRSESEDSIGEIKIQTWEYNQQGNLTTEFTKYANLTMRIEYSYDSLNRLTEKLTYLNQ